MLGQTFELFDLARLGTLAFIELLLSSDNAVILALLVHKLPEAQRKKALFIGIISAVFLRAGALLAISLLLRYKWIQLFGAAYLLYLSVAHFLKRSKKKEELSVSPSFFRTVVKIELFDILFAIDSIIAGLVFISNGAPVTTIHPKLWIVYVGGMIGLVGIRYAASLFHHLLARFPHLEASAYLIVGLLGLKLAVSSLYPTANLSPYFWPLLLVLFLIGLRPKKQ